MKNIDVIAYLRDAEPMLIKTQASDPVIAFDLAIRQLYKLPDAEKTRVVGITLKPEK